MIIVKIILRLMNQFKSKESIKLMKMTKDKTGIFDSKNKEGLLIVAGPCSVESEKQIINTAMALKEAPFHILRGGIWKPRTRPNSFEGVGGKGLAWLKKAGEAISKPVGTEVATPLHVELALSHGIDVLWIGARTTANPFSVQAIADALKGVDIPIMVKNPVSPDIELWLGALERIHNAGITQLSAIHRGFSLIDSRPYRNQPTWRIPIELKRRLSDIPMICDPSHICGKRSLLQSVTQEAVDLLFDGLMLEVHENPNSAISDKKQQITPKAFINLIKSIKCKTETSDNNEFLKQITQFRGEINKLDSTFIELLGDRMGWAEKIGKCKQKNNVSILQPTRWVEILETRIKQGKEKNLSENFITKIYQLMHEESIRHQENAIQ